MPCSRRSASSAKKCYCERAECRPPNNRDPQADEVEQCEPYLIHQIELIQPKLIVALGRHAAHSLLRTDLSARTPARSAPELSEYPGWS